MSYVHNNMFYCVWSTWRIKSYMHYMLVGLDSSSSVDNELIGLIPQKLRGMETGWFFLLKHFV